VAHTNELMDRLTAAVGMIMEDGSSAALTPMPHDDDEVEERLLNLELACRDAAMLVQAAQVLARRDLS
jgi:hypothetical protein